MEFHGVDTNTQFKKMRELAPEAFRAFLEFDQKAFKDGAIPGKMKELMALAIAHITQCPWCIQAAPIMKCCRRSPLWIVSRSMAILLPCAGRFASLPRNAVS